MFISPGGQFGHRYVIPTATVVGRGAPSRAPRAGSCLTHGKELFEETCADKARDFIGKGTRVESSDMWLAVLDFMVMGLISRLSLANHSDSESFLVVQASLSQDGCQKEGFWEVDGHTVSPSDLSRTLLVGGGLFIPYSLPGPPVIKQFTRMATREPGQGGWFQSMCFP